MFKKLKRMYELSKKDPKALEALENLSPEQLAVIPDEVDGKAEFLGEGTTEEYENMLKEDDGSKPWYDRLKNL